MKLELELGCLFFGDCEEEFSFPPVDSIKPHYLVSTGLLRLKIGRKQVIDRAIKLGQSTGISCAVPADEPVARITLTVFQESPDLKIISVFAGT